MGLYGLYFGRMGYGLVGAQWNGRGMHDCCPALIHQTYKMEVSACREERVYKSEVYVYNYPYE